MLYALGFIFFFWVFNTFVFNKKKKRVDPALDSKYYIDKYGLLEDFEPNQKTEPTIINNITVNITNNNLYVDSKP